MNTALRSQNGDLVARLHFLCQTDRQDEAVAILATAVPVEVLRAAMTQLNPKDGANGIA